VVIGGAAYYRLLVGTLGVVGTGVIGTGWVVRALSMGYDVIATDPAPDAAARLANDVEAAWPAVSELGLADDADRNRLVWLDDPRDLDGVDLVQESVPERVELKQEVLGNLDAHLAPDVIIASSTSGIMGSDLQARCERHPERVVVGHPFNPVYLLPLVEVAAGRATAPETVRRAVEHYETLAMHPLVVRNEIEGFLSDRLQEALWREILHIVNDGIATTDELDRAIVYGPGLRWAAMGTNLTFHLAGGPGGMRHMLEQFGPALELPWTKMVAPELTDELIERMCEGAEAQAAGRTVAELERVRDQYLIGVMKALEPLDIGAGTTLRQRRDRIAGDGS
jgi:carnitine 3-dehydrogenase